MSTRRRSTTQVVTVLRQAITAAAKRRARFRKQTINGNPHHPALRDMRQHETDAISTYRGLLARLGADQGIDELIRQADPEEQPEPDGGSPGEWLSDGPIQEAFADGLRRGFAQAASCHPVTGAPGKATP